MKKIALWDKASMVWEKYMQNIPIDLTIIEFEAEGDIDKAR